MRAKLRGLIQPRQAVILLNFRYTTLFGSKSIDKSSTSRRFYIVQFFVCILMLSLAVFGCPMDSPKAIAVLCCCAQQEDSTPSEDECPHCPCQKSNCDGSACFTCCHPPAIALPEQRLALIVPVSGCHTFPDWEHFIPERSDEPLLPPPKLLS
jgi:hypothetical protein